MDITEAKSGLSGCSAVKWSSRAQGTHQTGCAEFADMVSGYDNVTRSVYLGLNCCQLGICVENAVQEIGHCIASAASTLLDLNRSSSSEACLCGRGKNRFWVDAVGRTLSNLQQQHRYVLMSISVGGSKIWGMHVRLSCAFWKMS